MASHVLPQVDVPACSARATRSRPRPRHGSGSGAVTLARTTSKKYFRISVKRVVRWARTRPWDNILAFILREPASRREVATICVSTNVTDRQDKKTIFEKYILCCTGISSEPLMCSQRKVVSKGPAIGVEDEGATKSSHGGRRAE